MIASAHDLAALAEGHDIISLGVAADEVRRRQHGTRVTFVRVADVDVAPDAPIDIPVAAGEVRIVGVPTSPSAAIDRVRQVVAAAAAPVSAFALSDLEELAVREAGPLRALLEDLKRAGLESIAEAPVDRLVDPARAIADVKAAGLGLARLTIHQLPGGDALALYRSVAAVQGLVDGDGNGVIRAFAPLPRRMNPAVPTTGFDDVKRVALARLCLDEAVSIQVDWALYGPKLAQVALTMGADDLDGVTALDDQSEGRRRAPIEEVRRNILAAGLEPVERDGRFAVRA